MSSLLELCPCGPCKPAKVQKETNINVHVDKADLVKTKDFGYVDICAGVKTADNSYNCPILAINLYTQSKTAAEISHGHSMFGAKTSNGEKIAEGEQKGQRIGEVNAKMKLLLIPVEDVTHVSAEVEVKKDIKADAKSNITHIYADNQHCCDVCCDKCTGCLTNCCPSKEPKIVPQVATVTAIVHNNSRRVQDEQVVDEYLPLPPEKKICLESCRFWCCRVKKLVQILKRTKLVSEQEAERIITIKIEYVKYSNLDTPSHTRLLSAQDQFTHYKENFKRITVEFVLFTDSEINPQSFEQKKQRADAMCRTIMQLKGMKNNYPSYEALQEIIDSNKKRTIGDEYKEIILSIPSVTTATLQDRGQRTLPNANREENN